jgi:hypothetical protein
VVLPLKGSNTVFKEQIRDKKMLIKTKLEALEEKSMATLDFNKHRVTCRMYSPRAMMKMEKMIFTVRRNAVPRSPLQEIKAS